MRARLQLSHCIAKLRARELCRIIRRSRASIAARGASYVMRGRLPELNRQNARRGKRRERGSLGSALVGIGEIEHKRLRTRPRAPNARITRLRASKKANSTHTHRQRKRTPETCPAKSSPHPSGPQWRTDQEMRASPFASLSTSSHACAKHLWGRTTRFLMRRGARRRHGPRRATFPRRCSGKTRCRRASRNCVCSIWRILGCCVVPVSYWRTRPMGPHDLYNPQWRFWRLIPSGCAPRRRYAGAFGVQVQRPA